MATVSLLDATRLVERAFDDADIRIQNLQVREYPQETILLIEVPPAAFASATLLASQVDQELVAQGFSGFITVRKGSSGTGLGTSSLSAGVQDSRAVDLVKLLTARSRASETQPSLSYVRDVSANIASAVTARHHLVFGRRGAGKTSLLAEAKRQVEEQGHLSVWINVQTHRHDSYLRVFLWVVRQVCELVGVKYRDRTPTPHVLEQAQTILQEAVALLGELQVQEVRIKRLVPETQELLRRLGQTVGGRLYIFLDDFHYVRMSDQPTLLDMLHGAVRDTDAWLKIASIKHLSRWFQVTPPMGLQTGHDADHIDLDVTLEDPARAKQFLEEVLRRYATHVDVPGLTSVYDSRALDRLVLASGAVPRDYLVLCARSIEMAKARENAKQVGVQDVNRAAGDRAKVKLSELEDDAASTGATQSIVSGLQAVRGFCIDEKQYTFFRIDFKDREAHANEYSTLSSVMDVRLLHLVNPSVSDEHRAGERAEAFMLDLSQFTGQRLKQRLRVLDFVHGHLVLKTTGRSGSERVGDTSRRLLAILRRAPVFDLGRLAGQQGD